MKSISLSLALAFMAPAIVSSAEAASLGGSTSAVFVCSPNSSAPCVPVPDNQCFLLISVSFSYSAGWDRGRDDTSNSTRDVSLSDGTTPGSLQLPFSVAPGVSQALFVSRSVLFHGNVTLNAKPGRGAVTAILEGFVQECSPPK